MALAVKTPLGAFNRLTTAMVKEGDRRIAANYFYDALGRRIAKSVNGEQTVFGWDGDTLAYESNESGSTHYVYEAGSFLPLAQFVTASAVQGMPTPVWRSSDRYLPEEDPLQRVPIAETQAHLFYYHCDHIGTPYMMTDELGDVVWEATYKAWGETHEVIAKASKAAGVVPANWIRFQGQQHDAETGLHYTRNRYYDPSAGRFISTDPIGLAGGLNLHQFAPNAIQWVDPLGLARLPKIGRYHGPKPEYENPGHHDPSSGAFRGGGSAKTSVLPCNAEQLYKRAIPDAAGKHWYALDDNGVVHRFGNSNDGKVHWNGDSSQGRGIELPPDVKKRIEAMKKDGVSSATRCGRGR